MKSMWPPLAAILLPAATKLWPRLCFYSCLWFCPRGGGVCLNACWDTTPWEANPPGSTPPWEAHHHPEAHPLGSTPPWEQTLAYSQWVAGTHPTGMHSCLWLISTGLGGGGHGPLSTPPWIRYWMLQNVVVRKFPAKRWLHFTMNSLYSWNKKIRCHHVI